MTAAIIKGLLWLVVLGFGCAVCYWIGREDGHAQGLLDARQDHED